MKTRNNNYEEESKKVLETQELAKPKFDESKLNYPLPRMEIVAYFVYFCGLLAIGSYDIFKMSKSKGGNWVEIGNFIPGWQWPKNWLGIEMPNRDYSDYEWYFWSAKIYKILLSYFIHVIIGKICEFTKPELRQFAFPIYGMGCVAVFGNPKLLAYASLLCAVGYLVAWLTKSRVLVWVYGILLMFLFNNETSLRYIGDRVVDWGDGGFNFTIFVFLVSILMMRITSFCYDMCEATSMDHFKFWHIYLYAFYWPLQIAGPLMPYREFEDQFFTAAFPKWTIKRVWWVYKEFVRSIAFGLLFDFCMHHFYFYVLIKHHMALHHLSKYALGATIFMAGLFFEFKYNVIWGFPRSFARLDGLDPPEGPSCVIRISRYSQMWRNFDNGLYRFMRNYIYIPLGGSRYGLLRQFGASAGCFAFIYYWHGANKYLFVWTIFNFFIVSSEAIGEHLKRSWVGENIKGKIGPENFRRFRAACIAPFFVISMGAIQVFFLHDVSLAEVYMEKLIYGGMRDSFWMIVLFAYCGVNLSFEGDNYAMKKEFRVKQEWIEDKQNALKKKEE